MANENSRKIQDNVLTRRVALPNGANTVNTPSLDLGAATPFPITESFQVKLSNDSAGGANNKNVNIVLQDSADNVTFTNVAAAPKYQVTDNNGAGIPTGSLTFMLPPSIRRYIRGQAVGEANGGNAANGNLVLTPLF